MNLRGELFFTKQLGFRLLGLLFVWMVCRVGFYVFNTAAFPVDGIWNFVKLLFFGMRFDLAAIAYVNALLVVTYILPFPFRKHPIYQKIQYWIFMIFNAIALIPEVMDMGYFQFSFRRMIGSDLKLMQETTHMAAQFLADFWYFLIVYAVFIFLLNFIYKKTSLPSLASKQTWWIQILIMPIVVGLLILAMRGGTQLRPLMSLTAAQYVNDMRLMPLQSNTMLNLLFSVQQDFIEEKKYMPEAEAASLFSIHKKYTSDGYFKKENVFIIALESFGKEHIGFFNSPNQDGGYANSPTPFIDSLMLKSWYFENAYAAGTRSTQGIAALSAGIAALMDNALMFSPYQGNRVDGIAAHLAKKGYTSGFFHGSNSGSMEFERFSKLTGYQHFYDRTAYPNQEDYDGNWGIWDLPFFQFTAQKVDKYQQPFTAFLFSLSSHHPYHVEDFFEKKHPDEEPLLRAIRYTDYALQQFFETAKKMDWYDNTLFIITADHIGRVRDRQYLTNAGKYKIPLIFYKPNSDLKGKHTHIMQQTDVMPTVLDYLNFDEPFNAFGKSALDTLNQPYAYMYSSGIYQILNDSLLLSFDQEKTTGLYNYKKDIFLKHDIQNEFPNVKALLEKQLKATIQVHHQAMIYNQLAE